jgi:Malate synthase
VVVNAMNFGAEVFMADFEGSNTPTFDNLLIGQLNQPKALLREIDFSTPERRELAERKAPAVLATGAQLMVTAKPGHDAGPHGRADAVARTVQVLGASIHGAPVGRLLADALNGPGTPVSRITRTTVPAR